MKWIINFTEFLCWIPEIKPTPFVPWFHTIYAATMYTLSKVSPYGTPCILPTTIIIYTYEKKFVKWNNESISRIFFYNSEVCVEEFCALKINNAFVYIPREIQKCQKKCWFIVKTCIKKCQNMDFFKKFRAFFQLNLKKNLSKRKLPIWMFIMRKLYNQCYFPSYIYQF